MNEQKIEIMKKHLQTKNGYRVLDIVCKLGLDIKVSESSESFDRDVVNIRDWVTNNVLLRISFEDIDDGKTETRLREAFPKLTKTNLSGTDI